MDSDSDSDGSHISATPPSSPPQAAVHLPTPSCREILLSSAKSRTKTSAFTSRAILHPKISKKREKPPPQAEPIQSEPTSISPITSNLPFQIKKSLDSQSSKVSGDGLLHGGHSASRFASFLKAQDKKLDFETDDSVELKTEALVASDGSRDIVKEQVAEKDLKAKKLRKNLNLIGGKDFDVLPAKKHKSTSEGNFVRLNINGYGRKKFTFKNKRTGASSSYKRRKYYRKRNGSGGEGREEGVVLDEEGFAVDLGKGQGEAKFDEGLIKEAVVRVRNEASDENLLDLLKLTHGYDFFRDGQLEAIKMVLSGKSTMLVFPTGAGKSLCYQLPALVLPGVTLVVSPLVSLMIDQLRHLPPAIPGGFLSSSQTVEESSETLQLLEEGALKVLFVAPERFLNTEFLSLFSGSLQLSLVVIDEAHCVSEWSHNFRPSYMRLRASLLRGRLNARCILAMTATATKKTLCDVMHALEIPPTSLFHSPKVRDNLHLSVSITGNRLKDLMALLKTSPYSDIKSIIVYCKFQSETDMISKYLCDNNISAKSYHSGIPAKERSRTQDLFCSNRIKVIVATVAFGMGLDKSDVGAVIHYSIPGSLEEYVQEIGRAGRDGRVSYCHLLFDDGTYFKLRSLMYSDGVDEYTVNKLLCQVFMSDGLPSGDICSLVKESASQKFDMKEEVILTILTQLELGEGQYIHLLPQMNVTCALNFHETSPLKLAAKDIVVAAILKKSEMKDGQYVFHIPSVANVLGMEAIDLTSHLLSLKLKGEITYEMKDQAFCYRTVNAPKDICSLATQITKWLGDVETCKVQKLAAMYYAAAFAAKELSSGHGCQKDQHTSYLERKIVEYFNGEDDTDLNAQVPIQSDQNSSFLRADIKVFLQTNSHVKFTPRAIARILHGLASPAFPSATWSRTHFWYAHMDFKTVMEAAKAELINFLRKDANQEPFIFQGT
ncbi:ATP-dependent DNA helicase Q-like 5 isoform X2 [Andrographis paniculata]|uniref:ATP-dependent DNA helicase Q-like 5 isoform X2 n=1 Tax=Andrographis paniculata TaxID=175694 RepID=UPI0021E93158|nr:ATP-dependent DNA helicase Q-like 5 isoform X2 [Andrographis paniculata]